VTLTFDLLTYSSMSIQDTYIHYLILVSPNIYDNIVFNRFSRSLPPMTLTFDLTSMCQAKVHT